MDKIQSFELIFNSCLCQDLSTPSDVYLIILWTGYANSAVNPILYSFLHQELKVNQIHLTTLG